MNFGVAGGGRVSGSFVARLPRLASELGPVAAQSYRLASRIANTIGAGYAVRRYEDLNDSALILICAPAHGVGPIVSALAKALDCRGKTILLCEGGGDSRQLASLQSGGAAVGSIDIIPGFEGQRFVVEGDKIALREARRLASEIGGRVEEVRTAKLGLYAAALSFGGALFTPLMQASLLALQEAGMSKDSALRVMEAIFRNSLRAFVYAGKRSWSGPLADGDLTAVRREMEALSAWDPKLVRHYREAASLGFTLFGERAGLKNLNTIEK